MPFSEESSANSSVLLEGLCGSGFAPLHFLNLTSGLVSGEFKVGVVDSLPVPGVDLLIGNDLMGGKVGADPIVTVSPEVSDCTEKLEDEFPGIFPSCAVTRSMSKDISSQTSMSTDILTKPSMSKGVSLPNDSIYNLSGTFMDHSFEGETTEGSCLSGVDNFDSC